MVVTTRNESRKLRIVTVFRNLSINKRVSDHKNMREYVLFKKGDYEVFSRWQLNWKNKGPDGGGLYTAQLPPFLPKGLPEPEFKEKREQQKPTDSSSAKEIVESEPAAGSTSATKSAKVEEADAPSRKHGSSPEDRQVDLNFFILFLSSMCYTNVGSTWSILLVCLHIVYGANSFFSVFSFF